MCPLLGTAPRRLKYSSFEFPTNASELRRKSAQRALIILREEEERALQLEKPVDDDFAGLD